MATEKKAFEPKATLSAPIVEIATLDGNLIRIEEGGTFETADPVVALDLEAVDALKTAEKKGAKGGSDSG
jgi:hypothetical protein